MGNFEMFVLKKEHPQVPYMGNYSSFLNQFVILGVIVHNMDIVMWCLAFGTRKEFH